MLANTYTKAIRDRVTSTMVAAVSIAVMLFFGMAVYRDIDLSLYTDLPEAFRSLFGIGADVDIGGLAYGAILSSYGMLAIAGVAIAAGAASIGGEEKKGTIGLLLANPLSRSRLLVAKAGGLLTVVAAGIIVLWISAWIAPRMLDVSTTGFDITALSWMMLVNALFYGFLALAVSAWTGRPGLAGGTAAGVMLVSFLAAGLLPLIEGLADLAKFFPWYYFQNGDPLRNGIPADDFAVLASGAALFAVAGFIGLNRRDLKARSVGVSLLDRLRANQLTARIGDRLGGSARVSSIWAKTASEHQVTLAVVVIVMVWIGVMIGPMYNLIADSLKSFSDQFPEELLAIVGGGDMSTPAGFYQVEVYGLMYPIAVMVVTVAIGSAALAGEERKRTMGLLLANPVPRSTIVLQKTATMVLYAAVVAVATYAGTVAGSLIGNLDISFWNVAATVVLGGLLGLVFGAFALALGAATGRTQIASYGAAGVATVFYIANGFLPLSANLEGLARFQPFHYYLGGDPLTTGLTWSHAAILLVLAAALVAIAVVLFERRDLRQAG